MITKEQKNRLLFGIIFISVIWFATYCSSISCSILFAIIGFICFYEMWLLRRNKTKFIALSYIVIPFTLVQILIWQKLSVKIYNDINWIPNPILYLFVLTWTFDTFAYVTGVKFGKTKIMPSISPKKSWEGLIGGIIFTLIVAFLIYREDLTTVLFFSIFVPFSATLGDFIESYYKRQAQVKDSSNLIPGHGGMLDRMDSFLISISILSLIIITTA